MCVETTVKDVRVRFVSPVPCEIRGSLGANLLGDERGIRELAACETAGGKKGLIYETKYFCVNSQMDDARQ